MSEAKTEAQPLAQGQGEWLGPYFTALYHAILDYRRQAGHAEAAVSFEAFLDWLAHSGHPQVANEHWVPQVRILSPESVSYDFIGRFENLKADASVLMERMGCKVPFPTQESLDFPGTHSTQRVAAYYGERETALARQVYAADFDALGYSRSLPAAAP